ncbi:MAG: DUF6958 family protein [Flavisolibacter sp.]
MGKGKSGEKVECLNPNTGGSININKDIYDLFVKGIKDSLKNGKSLTYTELVEGIENYFRSNKIVFNKSISWYAVAVKHDLDVKGIIKVYTEKGKKLHKQA